MSLLHCDHTQSIGVVCFHCCKWIQLLFYEWGAMLPLLLLCLFLFNADVACTDKYKWMHTYCEDLNDLLHLIVCLLSISLYNSNGNELIIYGREVNLCLLILSVPAAMHEWLLKYTQTHTVTNGRKQCKGHLLHAAFCLHDAALTRQLTDPII